MAFGGSVNKKNNAPNIRQPSEREVISAITEKWSTIRSAVRWLGITGIGFAIAYALTGMAGKQTNVMLSAVFSVAADVKFVATLTLAGAACAWAAAERYMRVTAVKRLTDRNKDLETQIDPERSSSGLTRDGKTNPRDKVR